MSLPQSARASTLNITTSFQDNSGGSFNALPQRVAILAQGESGKTFPTDKKQIFSALEAGQTYGFKSPAYRAALQLLPPSGDGVGSVPVTVYPLASGTTAATGDITPAADQTAERTYAVVCNGIVSEDFVVPSDAVVADITALITTAINNTLEMPITATDDNTKVDVNVAWAGDTGNDVSVSIINSGTGAGTFAFTQPTGGTGNPTVDSALAQLGNTWETLIVNGLGDDAAALNTLASTNEGRWDGLVRRPFMAFYGSNESDLATAITVPDSRKTDRTNGMLSVPGSPNLPIDIAARGVARVARIANANAPQGYRGAELTGITAGSDLEQWSNYSRRDTAVKAGVSTTEVRNNQVIMSDTVTFYHPEGDTNPAYQYVVQNIKLMNVLYNIERRFNTPEFDQAPLLEDEDPTVNSTARKPKNFVQAANNVIDVLALESILTNAEASKSLTTADINTGNGNRIDLNIFVTLSGNTNITNVGLNFGFNLGGN